jgi:hypothetical protein
MSGKEFAPPGQLDQPLRLSAGGSGEWRLAGTVEQAVTVIAKVGFGAQALIDTRSEHCLRHGAAACKFF